MNLRAIPYLLVWWQWLLITIILWFIEMAIGRDDTKHRVLRAVIVFILLITFSLFIIRIFRS